MKPAWCFLTLTVLLGSCIASDPRIVASPVTDGPSTEPTGRYKEIVDRMRVIHSENPQYVSIFNIGENDDNVPIQAMRISTTPNRMDTAKTGHLVVSTHHGNELAAPQFTMKFVEHLLERYSSEELWRGNLAETEWTIIPVLNISGYNRANRNEHGRDPNRDYPGPCNSSPGGKLKSIRQLMNFVGSRVFAGTVTVHGYVGSLTYPWGVNVENDHTNDHNRYAQIVQRAAEENGYRHGTHTAVVYPATGTYEDWTYWKYGIWTLLLELRSGSESDINRTVRAIYKYFDQLDSSPSTNFEFNTTCLRQLPDLHLE